jgi:hypothetical protein
VRQSNLPKVRAVDLDHLEAAGRFLPAIYSAFNLDGRGLVRCADRWASLGARAHRSAHEPRPFFGYFFAPAWDHVPSVDEIGSPNARGSFTQLIFSDLELMKSATTLHQAPPLFGGRIDPS